jgi:hypothetical protein
MTSMRKLERTADAASAKYREVMADLLTVSLTEHPDYPSDETIRLRRRAGAYRVQADAASRALEVAIDSREGVL